MEDRYIRSMVFKTEKYSKAYNDNRHFHNAVDSFASEGSSENVVEIFYDLSEKVKENE